MAMATNGWNRSHLRQRVIGAVVALAVIAAGCGNGDDEAGATTTADIAATTATTTTDTTDTTGAPTSTTATTIEPFEETVEVYFSSGDGSDCSEVEGFSRPLPDGADAREVAFAELVAGPTAAETDAGAGSFFSSQTADVLSSITLTDGLMVVDFIDLRPLLNNASTSCGSEALLAQLNATAFQFSDVDRVRYRIEGSCDEFANWLQGECSDTDRDGNQLDVPTNERASGSGCTPPPADDLPDGRWFGFVDQADPDQLSFDLACWFTGTAAAAAAAEDGEESPPPNDFYIRNGSDRLRSLPVDPGAAVDWLPNPGDPASAEKIAYDVWLNQQPGRDPIPGVWLDIEGRTDSRHPGTVRPLTVEPWCPPAHPVSARRGGAGRPPG